MTAAKEWAEMIETAGRESAAAEIELAAIYDAMALPEATEAWVYARLEAVERCHGQLRGRTREVVIAALVPMGVTVLMVRRGELRGRA
jgi:transcription initiation factor TFIIIB Brf1 subunit/transcription initiation factor TFIIB